MDNWEKAQKYYSIINKGHTFLQPASSYQARKGSHDDGPHCGMFLGGIGTSVCSRNLVGDFDRWHLQPGYHVKQVIKSAYLGIYWSDGESTNYCRLDASWKGSRSVNSLFPVIVEKYQSEDKALGIFLEFFSPVVPNDALAQSLPIWYVNATVKNFSSKALTICLVFSFPNILGWKAQKTTSLYRGNDCWPSQTHAGNSAVPIEGATKSGISYIGVRQVRHVNRKVTDDMHGEVAIACFGTSLQNCSREICVYDGQHLIDRPPEYQKHTISWLEHSVATNGSLPNTGKFWCAHWDEALASATAKSLVIQPRESEQISFATAFDIPLVRFGDDRLWKRRYTKDFGIEGTNSSEILQYAIDNYYNFREAVDQWHKSILCDSILYTAAMINELYFLTGGGSAWCYEEYKEERKGLPDLLLNGNKEHFAILEGYDIGYYYYNTSDLWYYAWYAIYKNSPQLAELVFQDMLESIPIEIDDKRVFYRTEEEGILLSSGKIPHDFGSPMEDPWHKLNGYQNRDDSNLWKDHNPGFIISYYLYCKISKKNLSEVDWNIIKLASRNLLSWKPLPCHDAFGDTTWDNLGIQGYSSFSGGLFIASLLALSSWAEEMDDNEFSSRCHELQEEAENAYIDTLYDNNYFKVCDKGKYSSCSMPDSMLGLYFAYAAGLGDKFKKISNAMIKSHLKTVYLQNMLNFKEGRIGPILVAEKARTHFSGDGGDELQVNEVLIGSAWLFAAMLDYFEMKKESMHVSTVLSRVIYEESGLQFRTPAAIDGNRRFRAPLNMRPLSVWFLKMNEEVSKLHVKG